MSENNQEPTMEEILASIRRIISEDDAPADGEEKAEAAEVHPAPVAVSEPAVFASHGEEEPPAATFRTETAAHPLEAFGEEDDVLELTERLDGDPLDSVEALEMSDLEVVAPPKPKKSARAAAPILEPLGDDEPLVSDPVASEAAYAFGALERSLLMPAAGRTLEDVVREMLRPMLKAWLDEHLPSIVEAQVQAEVARIARQRR